MKQQLADYLNAETAELKAKQRKTLSQLIEHEPAIRAAFNYPKIGQHVTIRGVLCEIIKIRPLGAIDVAAVDINDSRAFRVSGLSPFPHSHGRIVASEFTISESL